MKKLATLIRLTAALLLAPALAHAQGLKDLGNSMMKNSADAAHGAAKKTAEDAAGDATGKAKAKGEAAIAPVKNAQCQAEAVHKNAKDTKDGLQGLGKSLKDLGK